MRSRRILVGCTAHGFGHMTRQMVLARALLARGHRVRFWSDAPEQMVRQALPAAQVERRALDVGIAQHDSLHEDPDRTRALLEHRCSESQIDRLAAELADVDLVIADLPPPLLEAARRAAVPAVAIGNFDWAWVYGHYPRLADWAETFARWQSAHPAVALSPGPGPRGFARTAAGGLLARSAAAHPLPPGSVLVSFGGLGLRALDALLPQIPGITWVTADPMAPLARPDALHVQGAAYPALVAGAALVLSKPGYGILAEASVAGAKLVWVPRGRFPEAPFLEAAMANRGDRQVAAGVDDPSRFRAALSQTILARMGDPSPVRAAQDHGAAALAAVAKLTPDSLRI